jgi:hypothetical protein
VKQRSLAIVVALVVALVAALALCACGGGNKPDPRSSPPSPGPAGEPSPGPAGAPATGGCAQEIALRCATGVDGCIGNKTTEHVCVPADARPGPPCEQEIAIVCPDGQEDACLQTPRPATNHICVFKK